MKIVIYGHGGSQNHGNEAIVRGVHELFPDAALLLYSFCPEADYKFGLDEICEIRYQQRIWNRLSPVRIWSACMDRVFNKPEIRYRHWFNAFLKEADKQAVYMLEAGDQYCEDGPHRQWYRFLNRQLHKRGVKTIMLGCTINPEVIADPDVIEDLKLYTLIIAREHMTYENLHKVGIVENVKYAPCPAFAMKSKRHDDLPKMFDKQYVVGMNTGFLAQGNEVYYENMMANFRSAIDFVLKNTDFGIALIPHVNWDSTYSDFASLNELKREFEKSDRVVIVDEHSASEQRYIISKCRFMIALRTHATIPALAEKVPTVIAGYKIKSSAIAHDIFTDDHHVLAHVQSLQNADVIKNCLVWLIDNEVTMRQYLEYRMPEYMEKLTDIISDVVSI